MSIDYTKRPPAAQTALPADSFPRRSRMDQWIPEERMIAQARDEVENLGAHPMLTDVSVLLDDAQRKLADWHDAGRPGTAE